MRVSNLDRERMKYNLLTMSDIIFFGILVMLFKEVFSLMTQLNISGKFDSHEQSTLTDFKVGSIFL